MRSTLRWLRGWAVYNAARPRARRLKRERVAAYAAAEGELSPCWWVCHFQRTLAFQVGSERPCGTWWQLIGSGHVGSNLRSRVARVAEVSGPETEPYCHRAAVATLVLQKIIAMLVTCDHLSRMRAAPTDKLTGIKRDTSYFTLHTTAKIRSVTFVAEVVGEFGEGEPSRVSVVFASFLELFRSIEPLVLQPQQRLPLDISVKCVDRSKFFRKIRMLDRDST